MEQVISVEQYSRLIKSVKNMCGKILYNTMLMPKEIDFFIKGNKLYYEMIEAGVLFLCDERDFYKGFFFVCNDAKLTLHELDKPLIVEFVYSVSMDKNSLKMEEKVQEAGFAFYVQNVRMKRQLHEATKKNSGLFINKNRNFHWQVATSAEKKQIYHLWKDLDPYDSIIPREKEFLQMIENEELICLIKGEKICAVFRLKEENKKTVSMWLVVVADDLRGLGVGKQLHEFAQCIAIDRGYETIWQWSDEKNERILNTVINLGFVADGTKSKEYILMF